MSTYRLPANRRLKNRRLIQALFSKDQTDVHRVSAGRVTILYRFALRGGTPDSPDSSDSPRFQFGIAVGRRAGNAVQRNRVKRSLREAVRLRQPDLQQALSRAPGGRASILTFMVVYRGTGARGRATGKAAGRDTNRAVDLLVEKLTS